MNLLLDTHVWLWSQEEPRRLGRLTKSLMLSPRNRNYICALSTLEVARLVQTGTVSLSIQLRSWIEGSLAELHANTIPVTNEIALEAYSLPGTFHADPVDRVLAGAARLLDFTLVTADERILNYTGVKTQNARL